jgi:asparagine synthase (glutamine-hydrolysing)
MGAIYGILGDAQAADIDRMGDRLRHRGSVGMSWSVTPRLWFGTRCGRERSGPSRPIIAFDGFIDNSDDVARLLKRPGQHGGDHAELLFALYEKEGPAGFRHVSGQFAVALWDASRDRLILACDPWLTRALYWTRSATGRCLFASEYKAFLVADDVPARPDRETFHHLHATKYVKPGASCLAGVHAVPGGCWVELSPHGEASRRYRHVALDILNRSEAAHATCVRRCFLRAIRRETDRYERIGVALSAGLDSAVTVAAARHVSPEKPLFTFTAGFGPDDHDVGQAEAVAKHFGASHHNVFLAVEDLPSLMPRTLWHMEDPIGREEKIFYYITAREAARHVSLLLAGHNADALYGGMPRHLVARAASYAPFARRALGEFYEYSQSGTRAQSLLGRILVAGYYRGREFDPPQILGAHVLPRGSGLNVGGAQPLSELLRRGVLYGANANSAIERIHGGLGVTFNSPFLDTEVVQCAFRVPDRLKIRGFRRKYILRAACAGLLPAAVLQRKKGLLRLKHDQALSETLDGMADDLLGPSVVADRGLFDPGYVARARLRPRSGVYPTEQLYRLWSLLMTELWLRLFIDARGDHEAAYARVLHR